MVKRQFIQPIISGEIIEIINYSNMRKENRCSIGATLLHNDGRTLAVHLLVDAQLNPSDLLGRYVQEKQAYNMGVPTIINPRLGEPPPTIDGTCTELCSRPMSVPSRRAIGFGFIYEVLVKTFSLEKIF